MVVIEKPCLPLPLYCSILHYCKIYVSLPPLEGSCMKSCQKNISRVDLLELKPFGLRASRAQGSWVLTKNLSSRWESDSFDHAETPWQEHTLSQPATVLCIQRNHGTTRIDISSFSPVLFRLSKYL